MMNSSVFLANWALWVAIVPLVAVIASVGRLLYRRGGWGQLNTALSAHRTACRAHRTAERAVRKCRSALERLQGRVADTKPRLLEEAGNALADAEALEKIAADGMLVTANHVRRVIFEEFPPTRQDRLRRRYLPQDIEDDRPFSFDT